MARYDLSKQFDIECIKVKIDQLIHQGKLVDLTVKHPKRTISQNSYLHLILSWFGVRTGYTLEEVKQYIFKEIVNPALFDEGETGTIVKINRWRSTADLNTAELTQAIDTFRLYSETVAGIYLPTPDDLVNLQEIENQIENQKHYLNS